MQCFYAFCDSWLFFKDIQYQKPFALPKKQQPKYVSTTLTFVIIFTTLDCKQ